MRHDLPPTRDRLIATAAQLFRQKGYHGVGLSEILATSGVPKGSLYHHFPAGKSDLALAAANWASAGMLRIIDDAFCPAPTYRDGLTTLCHKLAKFFDISDHRDGCPVSTILFQDNDDAAFRDRADQIFTAWADRVADHAVRLGGHPETAAENAENLLLLLQGGWVLARARKSSDILRDLPRRL